MVKQRWMFCAVLAAAALLAWADTASAQRGRGGVGRGVVGGRTWTGYGRGYGRGYGWGGRIWRPGWGWGYWRGSTWVGLPNGGWFLCWRPDLQQWGYCSGWSPLPPGSPVPGGPPPGGPPPGGPPPGGPNPGGVNPGGGLNVPR